MVAVFFISGCSDHKNTDLVASARSEVHQIIEPILSNLLKDKKEVYRNLGWSGYVDKHIFVESKLIEYHYSSAIDDDLERIYLHLKESYSAVKSPGLSQGKNRLGFSFKSNGVVIFVDFILFYDGGNAQLIVLCKGIMAENDRRTQVLDQSGK